MDTNITTVSLYDGMIGRVLDKLAGELKFLAASESTTDSATKISALSSLLTYPPITYFGKDKPYIEDMEMLAISTQMWLVNLTNSICVDWQMHIGTMDGSISVDGFMTSMAEAVGRVMKSPFTKPGYAERLDSASTNDPIRVTLYMMSIAYVEIAKSVGDK